MNKTKEEILKDICSEYPTQSIKYLNDDVTVKQCYNAMEAYASQFQSPQVEDGHNVHESVHSVGEDEIVYVFVSLLEVDKLEPTPPDWIYVYDKYGTKRGWLKPTPLKQLINKK